MTTAPQKTPRASSGFTLTELMVALVLASVATAAIYRAYLSFQLSYELQDQMLAMQQNLRIGIKKMLLDLRMAGYDPTKTAGAGITTASANAISFTCDISEDGVLGGTNENVNYSVTNGTLSRGAGQPIVDNVEGITLAYINADGVIVRDTNADGIVDTDADGGGVADGNAAIRSVLVSLTVKAEKEDPSYTDPTYHDHYRRRSVSEQVRCRNLGL